MTEFNPWLTRKILVRKAQRHSDEAARLGAEAMQLIIWGHYPSWHRVVREVESLSEAEFDRSERTKEVIAWLDLQIEAMS